MSDPVVFVTTELEPELRGGAGTVVAELAEGLAGEGRPVTVVLVTALPLERTAHPGVEVLVVDPGEPDEEAPTPFLARSRAAALAVAGLGALDRVEFQDFEGLGFWALARREELGLERTPLLVRMHAPLDLIAETAGAEGPDWPPARAMERQCFAMADGVLVASPPLAELAARRYGLEPGRVLVGEPPVPEVDPVPLGLAPEPEFVCLGRLGEQKGSDLFVEAAVRLLEEGRGLHFRLLGADGWSLVHRRPMVEVLAERIPAAHLDRIRFEPPVDRADLGRALASAWAVAFPSRFETFCLAAHEARALGHALVVPELEAFRAYFSEETGARVFEGGVAGLAAALAGLADEPGLVERLRDAPPPAYADPLVPYRGAPPPVRHRRAQAGLGTAALKDLEAVLRRTERGRRGQRLARAALRMLPEPAARLAVRVVPRALKDRLRRVADWREEEERRRGEARRAAFRRRVEAGEFPDLEAPEVTVVIPCYDQGRFLEEALMSVFEQSSPSFEVVVVDDGSTDPETVALVEALDLPRTTVLRQENWGLAAARNAGMRQARGRYLVPLDADDQLAPSFLERLVPALEGAPEAAFAQCWAELFGEQEAVWVPRPYNPYQLLLSNSVVGCVLLRREAWEEVGGYREDMRRGNEDWDLWLRLLEAGWGQVEVHEPLFRYRKHGASMSVITEARFEEAREEMRARHPALYARAAELKRRWYPWVSVLVAAEAEQASLGAQALEDREVIRIEGDDLARAVREAKGKFLIWWEEVASCPPDGLERLAEALEEAEGAMAALPGGEGLHAPALWRRWALLDPDSPHREVVRVALEAAGAPVDVEAWRGAFPTDGWATRRQLEGITLPVLRQSPEEEGRLPAWGEEGG